jgi:hypothetical protein
MRIGLQVEVVGCPTVCQHCWALGRAYAAMPAKEVAWVLAECARFCRENVFGFSAYPMHEILAHPDATRLLELFTESQGGAENAQFQPMATVGVPLAVRDDWREILSTLRALGVTTAWVHFHGVGEVHDRFVARKGAFEEGCLAVQRIREAGLRCGANVFVTRPLLRQFDQVAATLAALPLNEMSWEVASYYPSARARHYEAERPILEETQPHAAAIRDLSRMWKPQWAAPGELTEAAHVRAALVAEEEARPAPEEIGLVCRRNLDVHTGKAALYGPCHGNLRADGVETVLRRALAHGPKSDESLWFGTDALLPLATLARDYGDSAGTRLHFWLGSARNRWLDLAHGPDQRR